MVLEWDIQCPQTLDHIMYMQRILSIYVLYSVCVYIYTVYCSVFMYVQYTECICTVFL